MIAATRKASNSRIHSSRHLLLVCLAIPVAAFSAPAPQQIPTLHHDAAWCWFQDERAIIDDGKLIFGTVADGHNPDGTPNADRAGHIEVTAFDLTAMKPIGTSVLHENLQADDHDSPALLVRPDGRLLAVYAKHGPENHFYYRISSRPHDPLHWQPERTYTPTEASRITYSNLHYLSAENAGKGRIYNFFRGLDNSFKPSYVWSDDWGQTWHTGGVFIHVPTKARHRPYVKYASNGPDTIHVFYTEGHPRRYDNSVYHVFYRDGNLHRSDGTVIRPLSEGLHRPSEGTRIFKGDPDNVAWTSDIHIDTQGRPFVAYSVQKNSAGLPPRQGGDDHRYRYAHWDGQQWHDHEIAFGGSRLYPGEDDYTGNIALDPANPDRVYISTDVDPATGDPLPESHYQIFEGVTHDGGANWDWIPVTESSDADNIRPIVPITDGHHHVLLWLRGTYRSYTSYDLDVVGIIKELQ